MPLDDEGTDDYRDRWFDDELEATFDPGPYRPPPHPDDRLWRHPSELAGSVAAGRAPSSPASLTGALPTGDRARRPWALILLAGCAGAAAGSGALMTFGLNERTVDGSATEGVAASSQETGSPEEAPRSDGRTVAPADVESLEQALVYVEGPAGSGSGFVAWDDGTVLTSASVVGHQVGAEVVVGMADGGQVTGEIGGTDPTTDVAVVRLPDGSYPTAVTTRETPPAVGTELMLLGRVDDAETETAQGVLTSSTWRLDRPERPALIGLLQIAAGGGSTLEGGPVVDEQGTVVGMVTRGGINWSYATPIDIATLVAEDLLLTGEVDHGWIGIEGRDATGTTSRVPDPPPAGGVEPLEQGSTGTTERPVDQFTTAGVSVSDVFSGGPTDARLQRGDVIVALDGVPVPDMASLQAALLRYRPGDQVEISYYSAEDGSYTTATVTVDSRPGG